LLAAIRATVFSEMSLFLC